MGEMEPVNLRLDVLVDVLQVHVFRGRADEEKAKWNHRLRPNKMVKMEPVNLRLDALVDVLYVHVFSGRADEEKAK